VDESLATDPRPSFSQEAICGLRAICEPCARRYIERHNLDLDTCHPGAHAITGTRLPIINANTGIAGNTARLVASALLTTPSLGISWRNFRKICRGFHDYLATRVSSLQNIKTTRRR